MSPLEALAIARSEYPNKLHTFAIYDHPHDMPEKWVMRMFQMDQPTTWFWTAPTLEALRESVSRELICIPRSPEDEPQIVETWI